MVVELTAEVLIEESSELGEGPVWDPRAQQLRWVDITGKRVHSYFPSSGQHLVTSVDRPIGAIALRERDGLIVAAEDGFALLDERTGDLQLVAPIEADRPENRMNEGKCDHTGRFWAGTMAYDKTTGAGSLYCLQANYQARHVLEGVTISNGLAWTDDGHTMYYIDTPTRRVDAFDYDVASGEISNRRPFIEFEKGSGYPDGMSIDEDGCLWVAMWGGSAIRRYTPDGRLDRTVRLPVSNVSSCAFGGSNMQTLYITTAREGLSQAQLSEQPLAGSLFVAAPGVAGVPPATFAG